MTAARGPVGHPHPDPPGPAADGPGRLTPHRPNNGRLSGGEHRRGQRVSTAQEKPLGNQHQANPALSTNLTAVAEWALTAALLALWEVRVAYAREEEEP